MKLSPIVYVAAPYSDRDSAVRLQRFEQVNLLCDDLQRMGMPFISPISQSHPIGEMGHSSDTLFWAWENFSMQARCDMLLVYQLPGWEFSAGVAREVKFAKELGQRCYYHVNDSDHYVALRQFYRKVMDEKLVGHGAKEQAVWDAWQAKLDEMNALYDTPNPALGCPGFQQTERTDHDDGDREDGAGAGSIRRLAGRRGSRGRIADVHRPGQRGSGASMAGQWWDGGPGRPDPPAGVGDGGVAEAVSGFGVNTPTGKRDR